jgi:hypothetical protein
MKSIFRVRVELDTPEFFFVIWKNSWEEEKSISSSPRGLQNDGYIPSEGICREGVSDILNQMKHGEGLERHELGSYWSIATHR